MFVLAKLPYTDVFLSTKSVFTTASVALMMVTSQALGLAGQCVNCGLDTAGMLSRIQCIQGSRSGLMKRFDIIVEMAPNWNRTKETRKAAERLARHPVPGMGSTNYAYAVNAR
jgi:ABC-type sugar transport system substrate-binding protein